MAEARARLLVRASAAVDVLDDVAHDRGAPHAVRVTAATRLVSLALAAERNDYKARISALEASAVFEEASWPAS